MTAPKLPETRRIAGIMTTREQLQRHMLLRDDGFEIVHFTLDQINQRRSQSPHRSGPRSSAASATRPGPGVPRRAR